MFDGLIETEADLKFWVYASLALGFFIGVGVGAIGVGIAVSALS